MPKSNNQKLKLLHTLNILKKYSDEENPLNSSDIAEHLSRYGINAERKSIYDDISSLEGAGFDIIKTGTPKKGWFMGDREFEVPEIYLLCDAVRSAKFISAKKTRELLSKLNSMLSVYQTAKREKSVFFTLNDKCGNEEIYYSIDRLSLAIESKKQVRLTYSNRLFDGERNIMRDSREMVINPYALTWQDDHYYLIGNHPKYDNLIHLRLDRISAVELLNTNARHFSEVCEYKDFFDTADYTKKLFGMHTGELVEVEFCCNRHITEQVLDRFSEQIYIKKETENSFNFTVSAALSPALVTFIINYGNDLTVIKPKALRQMVRERAETVLKIYENRDDSLCE